MFKGLGTASAIAGAVGIRNPLAAITNPLAALANPFGQQRQQQYTGPPVSTAPKQSWSDYIKNIGSTEFDVSWLMLFIFAGAVPIPPLSYLGYAGINILVTGSTGWALAKAGAQLASYLGGQLLAAYLPSLWIWSYALMFSPWYIFDLVQMFDPNFSKVGFRTPFFKQYMRSTISAELDVYGKVSVVHILFIALLMFFGGYNVLDLIPSEITGGWKEYIKTLFMIVAGFAGLGGSLLAATTSLPGLFSGMSGGGLQQGGGIKTLDDITKTLAKSEDNSYTAYIFVAALLIAAVGGIALSVAREKEESTVE